MAAAGRGTGAAVTVEDRLFAGAYNFDFFQAVRLLERLSPEAQPVGHGGPPDAEAVRFRALPSVSFPPSALYELTPPTEAGHPPELVVAFFGLTGPSGVLPRHYTELLLRLQRDARGPERTALRDWLDLFNHRLVSLFHRAWSKYRFWLAYERLEHRRAEPDPFTRALLSLVGLGTGGLRGRLRVACREEVDGRPSERVLARVDDQALLFYGGLLAHRPRSAAGLEALLRDYFGVPAHVEQFRGQWLPLAGASRSCLGSAAGCNDLGSDLVLGERVWDVQSKFRVRLGPLSRADFAAFLPDRAAVPEGKRFFLLLHLVRLYAGPEYDVDVQLVLKADDVPECRLPESTADGPRLGWDAWLTSMSPPRDAGDAVFEGEEVTVLNDDPINNI